jgi:hypothetical protein
MEMRITGYWRPVLGAVAILTFALNTFAADREVRGKIKPTPPDNWGGEVTPPGPENTTMSPANNCAAPHAAGVLAAAGGVLSGDTYYAGNDFEDVFGGACNYSYFGPGGPSGHDEIWEFMVEGPGRWTFDTCTIPAMWDTSLGLYYDIGIGCPGVPLTCNGDDPCGAYWESKISDVCLQADQMYWLVVDGWSPSYAFPGWYYDVSYSRTQDPCAIDADCDDGDMCNGIEVCVDNCCWDGPPACPPWAWCDPDTQECVNVQDPCTAALNGFNSLYTATNSEGQWKCDDIQTWEASGDKLLAYRLFFQARIYWPDQVGAIGDPIGVETAIFTNSNDGSCLPDEMIPGTLCSFTGIMTDAGDPPQEMLCEPDPQTVVLPNRAGDLANCEVDFFLCLRSEVPFVCGPQIAGDGQEIVGGPAAQDEYGVDVVQYEDYADGLTTYCIAGLDYCNSCVVDADCDTSEGAGDGVCDTTPTPFGVLPGCFYASWYGGDPPADWADAWVCAEPAGACCHDGGGCTDHVAAKDCVPPDGYQGDNALDDMTFCADGDPDGDGHYFECDNCPSDFNPSQADCDGDGEGDACEAAWEDQDDDGDGCCNGVDLCPDDPAKCATNFCGCGLPDPDADGDGCYDGPTCVPYDECPMDPDKCAAGICGCGVPDEGDIDGDGVLDCVDVCPGVDDNIFAPGCMQAIPTVSEWGLVVLALLLLVAGKIYFSRRTATA